VAVIVVRKFVLKVLKGVEINAEVSVALSSYHEPIRGVFS
jgi:hypothetical protein